MTAVHPVARQAASQVDVVTVTHDQTRASLRLQATEDVAAEDLMALLEGCLRGHIEAGRRFLRLDVSGVDYLSRCALELIARVHHELLARRGTLVITGAVPALLRAVDEAGLTDVLLILGPSAAPPESFDRSGAK